MKRTTDFASSHRLEIGWNDSVSRVDATAIHPILRSGNSGKDEITREIRSLLRSRSQRISSSTASTPVLRTKGSQKSDGFPSKDRLPSGFRIIAASFGYTHVDGTDPTVELKVSSLNCGGHILLPLPSIHLSGVMSWNYFVHRDACGPVHCLR